jgi:N utilization substance protein B
MKRKDDPRHKKRADELKQLFALSFGTQQSEFSENVANIFKSRGKIDKLITTSAPEWPIDQINKVDLGVLRLAIFELINTKTPKKVVIDEAVELAKEYGSESSPKFVNGVLGTVLKKLESKK